MLEVNLKVNHSEFNKKSKDLEESIKYTEKTTV